MPNSCAVEDRVVGPEFTEVFELGGRRRLRAQFAQFAGEPLRRDERPVEMAFVELVVLAQPRRDDFFQVKSHGAMFCDLRPKRKW